MKGASSALNFPADPRLDALKDYELCKLKETFSQTIRNIRNSLRGMPTFSGQTV